MEGARPVRAARGTTLRAQGWQQEGALRMLENNLDPEVAERPDDLVVYGGTGRAARDWRSFDALVRTLTTLKNDETMLVQSGRPVGVFTTHEWAPRVLIANSNLVGDWATVHDPRVGPARVDRELQPGGRLGHVAGVPTLRSSRLDDVRPDDGGLVDLHRHPGHPAGHLRNFRRRRGEALRWHPRGHVDVDGRSRWHGWCPAVGGHNE